MIPKSLLSVCLLVLLTGCHSQPKAQPTLPQLVAHAYHLDSWTHQTALAGDVHIEFEDPPGTLDAHFLYDIKTAKTRMQLADDSIVVFDGQNVWVSPANSTVKNARAILRTWPLLVMFPFRAQDHQAVWHPTETHELAGQNLPAAKITLPAYLTDFPDQWYMLYAEPQSHRLQAVVYPTKSGDDERLAITFYAYQEIEGMLFSTEWRFWRWHPTEGIYGKPVGTARIYNLEFVEPKKNAFVAPAGARQDAAR